MTDQQTHTEQFENDIRELERLGLIQQTPDGRWLITPGGRAAIAECDAEEDDNIRDFTLTAKGRETASRILDN